VTRVVLVPGVLALLPEYAGLTDPVADLRAACLEAVAWLGEDVTVVADAQGERVARALLSAAGGFEAQAPGRLRTSTTEPVAEVRGAPQGEGVAQALLSAAGVSTRSGPPGASAARPTVVVGNGSACRSEKAPGFLDERAEAFDDDLRSALVSGDVSGVDLALGRELLASLDGISRLGDILAPGGEVTIDYDDAPFGVQYWVMRWGS
jgi:hypothetical protein